MVSFHMILMEKCVVSVRLVKCAKMGCVQVYYTNKLNILLYDWKESCLLIGPICLHKSLCLPGNWSKPVHELILHEN